MLYSNDAQSLLAYENVLTFFSSWYLVAFCVAARQVVRTLFSYICSSPSFSGQGFNKGRTSGVSSCYKIKHAHMGNTAMLPSIAPA